MYILQQPRLKTFPAYVVFKDEFTKEECAKIIEMAKNIPEEKAMVGGGDEGKLGITDSAIRTSRLHWMHWSQDADWIFTRLANVIAKTKVGWYPFSLSHMPEPIQLTRYLASEGGHYEAHKDMGDDVMSTRKLSLVVLLSDPSEFEGGQLEMLGHPGPDKAAHDLLQGTVVAFPSWELHRVQKLTKGERWSLVTWVHGPPFS
jgi:PKHD-type hydroxylase